MINLPSLATLHSRERALLIQNIMREIPQEIGTEAYLYCSVAKGYADQYSDIEITFLVDEVQETAVYENWLRSIGATVDPATMEWGGGYTTKSWIDGIFIEAAWRPFEAIDSTLEKVVTGKTTYHWKLVDAWHIFHAVPVKTSPRLEQWQKKLETYPDLLQVKLIEDAVRYLAEPHWYPLSLAHAYPLAKRHNPMKLAGELSWTVERALRILFAVNKQWEPDYKWLQFEEKRLIQKPERLVERVNDVFLHPDLVERYKMSVQLLIDTLQLIPEEIDVSKEIVHLQEALDPETLNMRED
ncbi:MAG: DUF4037 domain-containing protein [Chloroflexota bacterium]